MKKMFSFSVVLLIWLLAPAVTNAQTGVKTYHYPGSMKHYLPIPVDNSSDEYMMAGTLKPGQGSIHVIHTDAQGNPITPGWLYSESGIDQRTMSFLQYGDEYIVVALRRDDPNVTNGRDRIRVLELDHSGNIIKDNLIESTLASGSSDFTNLYPIHAIVIDEYLYICGYVNRQWSTAPAVPDYNVSGSKKAFVLQYHIPSSTVVAAKTYDVAFTYTSGLVNNYFPSEDYDIAIRLVPLSNGNIYVTGSCNIVQYSGPCNSLLPRVEPVFGSGTLNMVIDQSLNTVATNNPFGYEYANNEYGVGLIENVNTGDYFVVGNYFVPANNSQGFAPSQAFLTLTYLDNSFSPPIGGGITARWQFSEYDYAWGIHTLPSISGNDFSLIAGMQINSDCIGEDDRRHPSVDSYSPFIAEFQPNWNGTDMGGTSINYWHTYLTNMTTGPSTNPLSYHQLGGGLSNNYWSPIFATRRALGGSINDNVALTAPTWNYDYGGGLNLKFIYGDQDSNVPDCPDSYNDCLPYNHYDEAVSLSGYVDPVCVGLGGFNSITGSISPYTIEAAYPVQVVAGDAQRSEYNPYEVLDCAQTGGAIYRLSPTNNPNKFMDEGNISYKLMPNPAHEYVSIQLIGINSDEQIKIQLTDLTGRVVANLYNGNAAQLEGNNKLSLHDIAAGLYLVQVSTSTKTLPVQKLVIE